ncbi:MAG TPA: hypothetical protein VLA43_02565, partial [Longimicrobiales bacterium]|nr:hypothetical protein [Longimicrobiales bacterium]
MTAMGVPAARAASRDGVALAAVLLLTVALAVMAHAALLFSRSEVLVTRSEMRRLEGSYRAAAALASVELGLDSLPGTAALGTPWGPMAAVRLGAEMALLRMSVTASPSGEGRSRLLWAPHPQARLRGRSAAVVVGGAVVRELGAVVAPADPGAPCPAGATSPSVLLPWARAWPGQLHPSLGPVPLDALLARLPPGMPGPFPLDSAVARGIAGSSAAIGTGRGVLAVAGDLVLQTGTELGGWVWVGGDRVVEA